jgi:predicted secreted protein
MTIVQALVVFAVTWFLTFFVVLPLRFVSQDDDGAVVPGTPRGAPAHDVVGRKARITTVVALVLTVIFYGVVNSGIISIDDIDIFNRGAGATGDGTGG